MQETNQRCLNCNNPVSGNYCEKCGQSTQTSRISKKQLAEELQYGLLHINKGLFYTLKELLLKPGTTIRNYLEGKRVSYTKPFIFLIIWGAIYSLVVHFFHFSPIEAMNNEDNIILEYIPIYRWYTDHYSLVLLLMIPFFAFATKLLFKNSDYNYIEHLVVFSYINGVKAFILLLFYPLIYWCESVFMYRLANSLSEIYVIWAAAQFFKTTSWFKAIIKVLGSIVIAFIIISIIMALTFEILKHFDIKL